jgi:hypothetical protein
MKQKTKATEFQKYLKLLFKDTEFMRKLNYYTKIKEHIETGLEYFGYDYISAPDYHYDADFEKKIIEIKNKLSQFLGVLLKELNKGEEFSL